MCGANRTDPSVLFQLAISRTWSTDGAVAGPPLTEMARWKSEGHALPAFTILGRIAGRSDDDIQTAWTQGQRDELVESALKSR